VETLLANTINAETRPIQEGALLPEFLRFESGPWTVFYMAGENIRELRKAEKNRRVSVLATKNNTRKAA
jgi:hypothetical protein